MIYDLYFGGGCYIGGAKLGCFALRVRGTRWEFQARCVLMARNTSEVLVIAFALCGWVVHRSALRDGLWPVVLGLA